MLSQPGHAAGNGSNDCNRGQILEMIGAKYGIVTGRPKASHKVGEIEETEHWGKHQKKADCCGKWAARLLANDPQPDKQNQRGNREKILPPDSRTDVPSRIDHHQI